MEDVAERQHGKNLAEDGFLRQITSSGLVGEKEIKK